MIAGASSGLGPTYATYFTKIGYKKILLIDKNLHTLDTIKKNLIERSLKEDPKADPVTVYTYQYDFAIDVGSPEHDAI